MCSVHSLEMHIGADSLTITITPTHPHRQSQPQCIILTLKPNSNPINQLNRKRDAETETILSHVSRNNRRPSRNGEIIIIIIIIFIIIIIIVIIILGLLIRMTPVRKRCRSTLRSQSVVTSKLSVNVRERIYVNMQKSVRHKN